MSRLVVAAALAAALTMVPAASLAASRTIEVEPFSSIEISSGIEATIMIGDGRRVVAEAAGEADLDELKVEVSGGRFHAYVDWNLFDIFDFGITRTIRLTITVPDLAAIEANSGAAVTAAGLEANHLDLGASSGANLAATGVAVDSITAEASSGAHLSVAGSCDSAMLESSSGARIDASTLICANARAEASSGASIDVHATASVDAEASTGAGITIHGRPESVASEETSGADIRTR